MLDRLCEKPLLEKTRHYLHFGGHRWEIDEFAGDNAGLIVAEVELRCADEPLALPDWLGEEVSHDIRYYGSASPDPITSLTCRFNVCPDHERLDRR